MLVAQAFNEDDYADVRGPDTVRYMRSGKNVIIRGAQAAPMPARIIPMLATLVRKPFRDPEWIFETKWDGIRALCFIQDGRARLVSRSGQDMTFRYPELEKLPAWLDVSNGILDGELVVFDAKGVSRFQLLQQRIGIEQETDIAMRARENPVTYCVFDLLYFDGYDLTLAPLLERKKLLRALLKPGHNLQFSKHTVGDGEKAFATAAREQWEGIVAKHGAGGYVQRRSSRWLKIKTQLRQEVVIGGYTEPKGAREHFGALAVGVYEGDKLRYVGNVGGGFNRKSLARTFEILQQYKTKHSPFAEGTQPNEHIRWLEPKLVAEIKFAEWTADQHLRQPIFIGLRNDKDPGQVHFEQAYETKQTVKSADRAEIKTGRRAPQRARRDRDANSLTPGSRAAPRRAKK